jgi:L-lactate dehydrogenase (cytochrome)
MFYDYADSGSWTEGTYRANEATSSASSCASAWRSTWKTAAPPPPWSGRTWKMPVAIAPTGLTGMQHADGEILAARAAEKFGIPFTLSTMSICSIEDVAQARTTSRSGSSST